jgi:hypothetical protein
VRVGIALAGGMRRYHANPAIKSHACSQLNVGRPATTGRCNDGPEKNRRRARMWVAPARVAKGPVASRTGNAHTPPLNPTPARRLTQGTLPRQAGVAPGPGKIGCALAVG